MNRICIAAFFLIMSLTSIAQMKPITFEEYTLDNGLDVILHRDDSAPIAVVSVMYHVGSKDEDKDKSGFAHFFEHLLFEGSRNIGRGEFFNMVEKHGGALNANTWYDRTYYYVILPSHRLNLGLWLESERMLHAKVDEKGVNTQRKVVSEERSQMYDNRPYGTLLEETMKRAFTVHPYKTSVIGNMDHLANADTTDYQRFYETYYIPNNAVLSIAGNIDIEETKSLVEQFFGTIPAGKTPVRNSVVEPPLAGEVRDTVYDNIQLPAVVHAYRTPAQGADGYYAVMMLSKILSEGESSRLHRSLVDEQQLAVQVMNMPLPLEDPGVSLSVGIANVGIDARQLEEAMDQEIDKLHNELISEREYQAVLNQIENDMVNQLSSVAGIAERLANYKMYFGDANLINTELERYKSISREDIRKAAQQYFHRDNRVALYFLPKPQ